MFEPPVEEVIDLFENGPSSLSPENFFRDQGRLAISTELSAANNHSTASLRCCGSFGITLSLRLPR